MHSTDLFILSKSVPSEILILSYCNPFMLHTDIHLKKSEDNIYHLFQKISNNNCYSGKI